MNAIVKLSSNSGLYVLRENHFARVFSAKRAQEGFNRRSCCCSLFRPSARSTSPYLTRTVHSTGQSRGWQRSTASVPEPGENWERR